MTTLVLIRHGQTDWNVEGRWQGQADLSLNNRGREQARHVAEYQSQFEFVALYSSDLRRAMETAQVIGAAMGVEVYPDPRLREINLGRWQGMLAGDIRAQYPDEYKRWHESPLTAHPPDGEDVPALATRVLEAVNEIIARYPRQCVGIVAHELPIAVVLCRSVGVGLEHLRDMIPGNGAWSKVVLEGAIQ